MTLIIGARPLIRPTVLDTSPNTKSALFMVNSTAPSTTIVPVTKNTVKSLLQSSFIARSTDGGSSHQMTSSRPAPDSGPPSCGLPGIAALSPHLGRIKTGPARTRPGCCCCNPRTSAAGQELSAGCRRPGPSWWPWSVGAPVCPVSPLQC